MGRIRTIKPDFPQSESMGNVGREARLCFILLWTVADDSGRLRGNSRMLASLLFPYDSDASTVIDGWLDELEAQACINRYQVDGSSYIEICKWLIHQKIDKPSQSKLPSFDEASRGFANAPRRKGREGKGMDRYTVDEVDIDKAVDIDSISAEHEVDIDEGVDAFTQFWAVYPRKQNKQAAVKAWAKLCPGDELVRAILADVAAKAGSRDWVKDGGAYIPHPSTYLNGRRWEDSDSTESDMTADRYRNLTDEERHAWLDTQARCDWWVKAGYPDVRTAGDDGCLPWTAHNFSMGTRKPRSYGKNDSFPMPPLAA